MNERPCILLTNDDGIHSVGLWAAAQALLPLGEVVVVAPDRQWSGAGRSFPQEVTGHVTSANRLLGDTPVTAYAVDASPALAVVHALTELLPRRPDLVVSGINSGANLSTEVTISGTVGAALEAAAFGLPAIAVSLEMDPRLHLVDDPQADYAGATHFTRYLAERVLATGLPIGVDVLNLNIPADATAETPLYLTRLARQRYFEPTAPDRARGQGRPGYCIPQHRGRVTLDSDIHAVQIERAVSLTPLTLDLTANAERFYSLWRHFVAAASVTTVPSLAEMG